MGNKMLDMKKTNQDKKLLILAMAFIFVSVILLLIAATVNLDSPELRKIVGFVFVTAYTIIVSMIIYTIITPPKH